MSAFPSFAYGGLLMCASRLFMVLILISGFSLATLQGQSFTGTPAMSTWDDDALVTTHSEEKGFLVEPRHGKRQAWHVDALKGMKGLVWKDGTGWGITTQRKRSKGETEWRLHRYTREQGWVEMGSMVARDALGDSAPEALVPLQQEDRFLGFSVGTLFHQGREYSPLAVFRLKKGIFDLDHLVTLPTSRRVYEEVHVKLTPDKTIPVGRWSNDFSLASTAVLATPVVLPDHYVFCWERPGWFWILRAKDGEVHKLVRLYAGVEERDLSRSDEIDTGVLGVQPTADGLLLVVAREESAVLHSMTAFDTCLTLERFNAGQLEAIRKRQEAALAAYPLLQWWHIEPDSGKVYAVAHPLNTPKHLGKLDMLEQFRFRFKTDGNLDLFFNEEALFRKPTTGDGGK